MFRSTLALVVLVTGTSYCAFNYDTIGQTVSDVVSFYTYDPRTATLGCMDEAYALAAKGLDTSAKSAECAAHGKAWTDRDGAEIVLRDMMAK